MAQNHGFSLNELMIVLLIISILCSFAIPSYQHYLIRSRRTDATLSLQYLAANLDHYYNQYHTYQNASLDKLHVSALSKSGYYQLSIEQTDETSFMLTASPIGPQAQDKKCGVLSLDSIGNESARGSSADPEHDCW
ncbi:MAG: pilE [Gammaproteobacteria bacterium]|jgi:type IV pilus assembly protein PilE|nr:pilE [Gammaproteobacteria bacterium]